jgi:amino acid transporter
MLFTAISYGRMARAYPSAGSAYTYVGKELHPSLGYLTGWAMIFDYVMNPIICVIWCSKAAMNFSPEVPFAVWAVLFALLFTSLNLRGIQASARTSEWLAAGLGVVIVLFFLGAIRYLLRGPELQLADFTRPFYDPQTFSLKTVATGTSIAVLTYIGFDGISTLSEEAHNPRRNILWATVLTCLVTGVLAATQVYTAQLVWPVPGQYPDVDTAFVHIAGRAGGPLLFFLVNLALLVATIGSGSGSHLAAGRLLYGMGRDHAIPNRFFGAVSPGTQIPANNILLVGAAALIGAFVVNYQLGAELLNFGAFIGFMGVNLSALTRYYVRADQKRFLNLAPPLLGFLICLCIWLSLRTPAKVVGFTWLATGLLYGAWRTRWFTRKIDFAAPEA